MQKSTSKTGSSPPVLREVNNRTIIDYSLILWLVDIKQAEHLLTKMECEFKYENSEAFGRRFFLETKNLRHQYSKFTIISIKRKIETGTITVKVKMSN